MSREQFKRLLLNTFAFTLFCYCIAYSVNPDGYASYLAPLPGALFIIYVWAFVDMAVALSIATNKHVRKTCYMGGFVWLTGALLTFICLLLRNEGSTMLQYALLQFVTSLGFTAVIFYIGLEAE
jgi:hypothetical protein